MSALRRLGWVVGSVAALSLAAPPLRAQQATSPVRMSVVAGLAVSELVGDDATNLGFEKRSGMHLGIAAILPLLGRTLSVAPGGTYLDRGYKSAAGRTEVKLSYLEVSAPLRVTTPPLGGRLALNVFAGPGFALEFGCLYREFEEGLERSTDCEAAHFDYRGWDVTGVVGAGLSLQINPRTALLLNGAIDTSLISIDSGSPKADLKHRSLLINAGVSFPLESGRRR